MKKTALYCAILTALVIFMLAACKKDETSSQDEWSAEEQHAYEEMIILQEQGPEKFDELLLTLDSSEAKQALADWFSSNPTVEEVIESEQGISVIYKNGLWGGVLINPQREDNFQAIPFQQEPVITKTGGFKLTDNLIPSHKKVLLYSPVRTEFSNSVSRLIQTYTLAFPRVNFQFGSEGQLYDEKADLEKLKDIDGFGYIHFDSHGVAWPNRTSIQEVYLLTGEKVSLASTKKNWKDLKEKKIITITVSKSRKTCYFVSPSFIADHNDFSNDTVLMYGGFCYGFLGKWKDFNKNFKKGTYIGADWSVDDYHSINWAIELALVLTHKGAEPYNLWSYFYANPTGIPKFYYETNNRKVTLNFSGNMLHALWKLVKATIKPAEANGAPVTVPGKTNTAYTLKCSVEGENKRGLKYVWNFGDGTALQEVYEDSTVNHEWQMAGSFMVTVDVKKQATQELLVSDTVQVTIAPDLDLIAALHNLKHIQVDLPSDGHHYYSNGSPIIESLMFIDSWMMNETGYKLTWDGVNFSVAGHTIGGTNIEISGAVSADGQTLVYVNARRWYPNNHDVTIGLANVPFSQYNQGNPDVWYSLQGAQTQSYVTKFEYKYWNGSSWDIYSHSDWNYVTIEVYFHQAR